MIQEYTITRIGSVEQGIDGNDEYLLVMDGEENKTTDEVEQDFFEAYYRDTDTAGAYFCHYVTVVELPSNNEWIVIIHHRYDV